MANYPVELEKLSSERLLARFGMICRQEGRIGQKHDIGRRTIAEIGTEAYTEFLTLANESHEIQRILLCRLGFKTTDTCSSANG